MTVTQFDPTNWLLSATRVLGEYVSVFVDDEDVKVEMSFPDTTAWPEELPLKMAVIHFEQDEIQNPMIGFGNPGVEEIEDIPDGPSTWTLSEAAWHEINFDVGVWVSAEMGGATKRMELVQKLTNLFTVAGFKQNMLDETGGLWAVNFTGGRNALDRVNDIPVWRAMDMTLILRVSSKHVPPPFDIVVIGEVDQVQDLTIYGEDGLEDVT
jgi:hypothetical protein